MASSELREALIFRIRTYMNSEDVAVNGWTSEDLADVVLETLKDFPVKVVRN